MNTSVFDTEAFMNQEQNTGELDTKYPKAPENDYNAIIDNIVVRQQTFKNKEGNDEVGLIADVNYKLLSSEGIDIAEIKAEIGVADDQDLIVRGGIFLDVDWTVSPPGINIGTGVNVKLGSLLESVGLNGGSPWSFGMLKGAGPLVVRVRKKANSDDPDDPYVNVTRTAPLLG